jgi:hypothetical protein
MWCKKIYADNAPDPETGRVHCQRCEAPFPDLAAFVAAGLPKYPRYCKACRADGRLSAAPSRRARHPRMGGAARAGAAPDEPDVITALRRGVRAPALPHPSRSVVVGHTLSPDGARRTGKAPVTQSEDRDGPRPKVAGRGPVAGEGFEPS